MIELFGWSQVHSPLAQYKCPQAAFKVSEEVISEHICDSHHNLLYLPDCRVRFRSMQKEDIEKRSDWSHRLKVKYREAFREFRALQGDPHYVAVGMGLGVFVGVTPTIPFHTAVALTLAFIAKGSKPAAAIGVWFSNPVTIPLFYWASYKIGMLMLGNSAPPQSAGHTLSSMLQQGLGVTIAMIAGGILLGIIPGIVAYFVTLRVFTIIRSRKKRARIK